MAPVQATSEGATLPIFAPELRSTLAATMAQVEPDPLEPVPRAHLPTGFGSPWPEAYESPAANQEGPAVEEAPAWTLGPVHVNIEIARITAHPSIIGRRDDTKRPRTSGLSRPSDMVRPACGDLPDPNSSWTNIEHVEPLVDWCSVDVARTLISLRA